MVTETLTPEAELVIQETEVVIKECNQVKVIDNVSYAEADRYRKLLKEKYERLDGIMKSITAPLDLLKKNFRALFVPTLENIEKVSKDIKRAQIGWEEEQETKRRAEEARLAEIQRKESERLAKRAEQAEAKGKTEKAEELRQQAEEKEMFVPTVAPTFDKVVSSRVIWKFEVIDKSKIPLSYLVPDLIKIGQVVRATKNTLPIAGIRIYSEKV